MPWVPFLQCAPAEKPWLISSVRDLLQDEEVKKEWEEKYKEEKFGWPGANSTYKEKLKWGNKICEIRSNDFDLMFSSPDPDFITSQILYNACPQEDITLEFFVKKKNIKFSLKRDATVDKFLDCPYLRQGFPENTKTLEQYEKWLKKQSKGRTNLEGSKYKLFATKRVKKDNDLNKVLEEFYDKIGLRGGLETPYYLNLYGGNLRGFKDLVGEMPYYLNKDGGISIGLIFCTSEKETKPLSALSRYLKSTAKQTGYTSLHILKSRVDEKNNDSEDEGEDEENEEQEPLTKENTYILWCSADLDEATKRIKNHTQWGEGESMYYQKGIQRGTTFSGDVKHWMFNSHIEYMKQLKNFPEKLVNSIGIATNMVVDNHWMFDNESTEEIEEMIKKFATYLRTILLKKTDEELGLGLPHGLERKGKSREALYAILDWVKNQFEEKCQNEYFHPKFNFKPGKERKKRKSSRTVGTAKKRKITTLKKSTRKTSRTKKVQKKKSSTTSSQKAKKKKTKNSKKKKKSSTKKAKKQSKKPKKRKKSTVKTTSKKGKKQIKKKKNSVASKKAKKQPRKRKKSTPSTASKKRQKRQSISTQQTRVDEFKTVTRKNNIAESFSSEKKKS